MFVFGFTSMMGMNQTAIAASFGQTRAAFSKRCIKLKRRFGITGVNGMRSEAAVRVYKLYNGAMRSTPRT
jgi:hypothetical protein